MEQIAEIVRNNPQITVISDEVYKFSIYDPLEAGKCKYAYIDE